jgi:hypothetical protein
VRTAVSPPQRRTLARKAPAQSPGLTRTLRRGGPSRRYAGTPEGTRPGNLPRSTSAAGAAIRGFYMHVGRSYGRAQTSIAVDKFMTSGHRAGGLRASDRLAPCCAGSAGGRLLAPCAGCALRPVGTSDAEGVGPPQIFAWATGRALAVCGAPVSTGFAR